MTDIGVYDASPIKRPRGLYHQAEVHGVPGIDKTVVERAIEQHLPRHQRKISKIAEQSERKPVGGRS